MPVADLTPEQVCALVYHLLYWSGADSHDLLATLRSGQLPIGPQFRSRGCLYEY